MESLVEQFGAAGVLAASGLAVGLLFGIAGQHSRFCLRAAVSEVADFAPSNRFAVWVITFGTALVFTQLAIELTLLDASQSRQLSATGSLSGAIVGGLIFGAGMILARGCASRLLILSGTGNLRALLSGLVLTVVAQASLRGVLSPAREHISGIWLIEGGDSRDLLAVLGLGKAAIVVPLAMIALTAIGYAYKNRMKTSRITAAVLVGIAVTAGWVFTYQISQNSFDVVGISSVTFTGPATDTLMVMVNENSFPMNFGIGLVIGVFAGSFIASVASGEFKIERFETNMPMERYLVGASMMGFGAMLAGGCAVGAGVSGSAIFSLTAWVAIFFIWVGAFVTQQVLNHRQKEAQALA